MAGTLQFASQILGQAIYALAFLWFLWVPFILYKVFWMTWVFYVQARWIASRKWILLEIKVPREVAKSPKAMENIFAGINGTARTGNLVERFWNGLLWHWFSLEIVGDANGVHFYIWTTEFFKRMLESHIYAQYPSCEIKQVEDYTKDIPRLPAAGWNLWGTEFILANPSAYPIRTYEDFPIEEISAKEEERKIDPMASLVEFFGTLKNSERLWLQIIVRPAKGDWKKEGETIVAKLTGKPEKLSKPPLPAKFIHFINSIVMGILGITEEAPKKQADQFRILNMSPGEVNTVKAIEQNISKIGLETGIRWMYLAKKEDYNALAIPATFGIFTQFSSQTLNRFTPNKKITTSADYVFTEMRLRYKKRNLFNSYVLRSFFHPPYQSQSIVLSTTELATIFHFPGMVVGAPSMSRVEAKRGAPPPNLPV